MTSSNIFRIFVSSTFSDMGEERNALHERVFPRLRDLCASHGARFQPIDLRWGISDEAAHNQQTVAICLAEIERCQQMTRHPNFIVLLGDRYGWQPPPAEIPHDEFEAIFAHTPDSADQDLLNQWYRRDDNAVPPVCSLQPRTGTFTDSAIWNPIERQLRRIVEAAAPYLPEDRRAKYLTSVTEQEIERGIFAVEDPAASTFCFFRTITGLPVYPDLPIPSEARRYVDVDENNHLDTVAQARLHDLKQRLRDRMPDNVYEYEARWTGTTITTYHLDQLYKDVEKYLSAVIESESKVRQRYTNPWEDAFTAHLDFGQERARSFVGRGDVIERIGAYLAQPTGKPLVVYGESGSGKTTVMGRIMQQVQTDYPQAVQICRFIGVTPGSSDIRSLLESLCRQLQWRTGASIAIPTDYHELISTFATLLTQASAERPLIVLLDALDQLSTLNEAHKLGWLPVELPDHVRLICSTLPGNSLDVLREKLDADNLVEVGPLSVADGRSLLRTWLSDVGRTLEPPQEAEVLRQFETNGRPLYLRLAFEEARLWKSDSAHPALSPDIPGIIRDNLFARLSEQANHGPLLVSHALAYLVATRNGLAENELLELLAQDNKYWSELERITKKHKHKLVDRSIPVVIWSRLYFDLRPYLTERSGDGTVLLAFYHRQLREAAESCYLSDPVGVEFHQRTARFFEEQKTYLDQNGAQVPNQRKLSELPYQHFHGGQMQELCALLTDSPEWMEAQFAASSGDVAYMADLELAISGFVDLLDADQVLILAQLHAARQVVHARVSIYADIDLKTLVWLGREQEALNHARLRNEPHEQFNGLMAIYEVQKQQNRAETMLLNSLLPIARGIPVEWRRAEALCALATALAQVGNEQAAVVFHEASELSCGFHEEWRRAFLLRRLVLALAQAGRFHKALEVAHSIQDGQQRASTLAALTATLAQAGRFHEAMEVAHAIQYNRDQAKALHALAVALAQAGQFREAIEVAHSILEDRIRVSALSMLVAILVQVGAGQTAVVFRKAMEVAHRIQDNRDRAKALTDLVIALGQVGDKQAAVVFREAMEVAHTIQYDRDRAKALIDLAAALARSSDEQAVAVFSKASEVVRNILEEDDQAKTQLDLVVALIQSGRYSEASKVTCDIQDEGRRAEALSELAVALAQAGRFNEASMVFREAGEMARDIQEEERQAKALRTVAAALAQAGQFDEARDVARSIQNKVWRASALRGLAVALVHARHFAEAFATFRKCESDEFVQEVAEWNASFDILRPGLSIHILQEVLRIIGWERPDLSEIHQLLTAGDQRVAGSNLDH